MKRNKAFLLSTVIIFFMAFSLIEISASLLSFSGGDYSMISQDLEFLDKKKLLNTLSQYLTEKYKTTEFMLKTVPVTGKRLAEGDASVVFVNKTIVSGVEFAVFEITINSHPPIVFYAYSLSSGVPLLHPMTL